MREAADARGDVIELPRPRDYEMRLTPEFNEIKSRIWDVLKEELTARV